MKEDLPEKQGLKHQIIDMNKYILFQMKEDLPEKQGLKLFFSFWGNSARRP